MSTFTNQFVFAKIKLKKTKRRSWYEKHSNPLGVFIVVFYFFPHSFFLDRGIILITFVIFILVVKIIPHPDSHRNPFAFGLRFRKRH